MIFTVDKAAYIAIPQCENFTLPISNMDFPYAASSPSKLTKTKNYSILSAVPVEPQSKIVFQTKINKEEQPPCLQESCSQNSAD